MLFTSRLKFNFGTPIKYLAVVFLCLSTSVIALEKVSLQLDWKFQFEHAGFIMAKEKGYYADIGLDVDLREYTSGVDIVGEVLSGHSNYGIYNSSIVINDGLLEPVILMATYFQRSPLVFVVSKDIKKPEDLIGKVIAGTKDELKYSSLALLLDHFNVNHSNSIFIDHSFGVDDFIYHKVDAMTAFRTNQLYILDQQNIDYNIIDPAEFGFTTSAVNMFTAKAEALSYPQRTRDFIKATNKGWNYALQNIDETIEFITNDYSSQKSLLALNFEAEVTRHMMLLDLFEIGETRKLLSLRAASQFRHSGLLMPDQRLGNFLFEEFLTEEGDTGFLTPSQQLYLQNKKIISMCVDPDWMPFESIRDGKHIGITADIFTKFKTQLPIPIRLNSTQSWEETLNKAKSRDCDIFSLASSTPERLEYMDFTSSYINLPIVMATKIDTIFLGDIEDVKDKRLGVVKGYAIADILKKRIKGINIIEVDSISDGLRLVESGDLFGYIDNLMVIANLIQTDFTGVLKVSARLDDEVRLAIGTRNDEPILKDIFEVLIQHITVKEKQRIFNRWVAVQQDTRFDYKLFWQLVAVILILAFGYFVHYRVLKKGNAKLRKLSTTDKLTGLNNRLKMDELLIAQQAHFNRYHVNTSVILIDIDFFKKVNDGFGHPAGDGVLIQFAKTLKDNVRVTDSVGRWGGEEFLIICPNINKVEAAELAEKILLKIRQQQFIVPGKITASAGVSSLEIDMSIQKIMFSVDKALYTSKQRGRDRVSIAD